MELTRPKAKVQGKSEVQQKFVHKIEIQPIENLLAENLRENHSCIFFLCITNTDRQRIKINTLENSFKSARKNIKSTMSGRSAYSNKKRIISPNDSLNNSTVQLSKSKKLSGSRNGSRELIKVRLNVTRVRCLKP